MKDSLGIRVSQAHVRSAAFSLDGIQVARGEAIEDGDVVECNTCPGVDLPGVVLVARR